MTGDAYNSRGVSRVATVCQDPHMHGFIAAQFKVTTDPLTGKSSDVSRGSGCMKCLKDRQSYLALLLALLHDVPNTSQPTNVVFS